MNPTIEDIPVRLGDIIRYLDANGAAIPFAEATRVRGWSPDGSNLLLDWVGVAPVKSCQ